MKYQEIYKKLIQTRFEAYCYHVHKGEWKATKFHKYLCDEVQKFLDKKTGNPYDILVLSTPPQVGKSKTITETLPSFYLMRNPKDTVIELSYSGDFAKKFGRRNKEKVQEYGFLFGCELSSDTKSASEWELGNKLGRMISNGIDGQATGNKGNLIIIDDPIKSSSDADSKTKRDRLWDLWFTTFRSRIFPGGKVILIMTRWHEDDLAGRLSKDPFATVINIPMEAEEKDPIGRKVGEAICPEIGKDNKWLKQFKEGMLNGEQDDNGEAGIRAWNSLYQGHPTSAEGNLLKREWWKEYSVLPTMDKVIMSVDCTFKNADTNDYVAIEVWGKSFSNFYLIDLINEHLSMKQTVSKILAVKSRYPSIREILIEDKANGPAVREMLENKVNGVIMVNPLGGKEARVNAVSYVVESGNCYLPPTGFAKEFIEQCAAFPNGVHDDLVDSFSQGLARLIYSKRGRKINQNGNYLFPQEKKRKRKEKIIVV